MISDDKKISDLTVGELKEIIREILNVSYTPYQACPQPFYYKPSPNPWDDTYKVFCNTENLCGSLGHKQAINNNDNKIGD